MQFGSEKKYLLNASCFATIPWDYVGSDELSIPADKCINLLVIHNSFKLMETHTYTARK